MPDSLGKYQLIGRLGAGGMAEVYLATQEGPGGFKKSVAIKRVMSGLADNDELVAMFLDEARLAARFTHPNLVQIFDFGRADDAYFVVMEYVDGVTLARILRACRERHETLPIAIAARVVSAACDGLQYAHAFTDADGTPLKLVHRDVNPQNIMLSYDGVVKLLDFGVAKASINLNRTDAGTVKGKLPYASPEQLTQDIPIDQRSDVFSLGTTLFELTTGELPFMGASSTEVMAAVVQQPVPDLRLRPNVPEGLATIITRCLEKSPAQRYQSARALAADLESFLRGCGESTDSYALGAFLRGLLPSREGQVAAAKAGTTTTLVLTPPAPLKHPPEESPSARERVRPTRSLVAMAVTAVMATVILVVIGVAALRASSNLPIVTASAAPVAPPNESTSAKAITEPPPQNPPQPSSQAAARPSPAVRHRSGHGRDTGPAARAGEDANRRSGTLVVASAPAVEVLVDGTSYGTTPTEIASLVPGEHTLELANRTLGIHERERVSVTSGTTRRIDKRFREGLLRVSVQPFGEVFVDGVSRGMTPLDEPLKLFEGTHTLLVKCSRTGKEEHRSVKIDGGETRRINLDLR